MNFYSTISTKYLFLTLIFAIPTLSLAVFKPISQSESQRQSTEQSAISEEPNQTSYMVESPFYSNEKEISEAVKNLISNNRDGEAFQVMKNVIAAEKKWRFNLCLRWFGTSSCSKGGVALIEPFFMWKKKLVHELLMDPTQEIIEKIRGNVGF